MSFISGFQAKKPDLCLLDVQLNDNRNGLDVLKELQLRGKIKIPFIFISQEFQNFRKTNAYQLGAVDYIKKPLEKDELKHKVSNILDLIYSSQNQSQDIISLDENNLSFTMKIEDEDIVVRLTPKEFVIFKQLIKNKDSIVTREQILSRLEDSLNEKFVVDRVIDVHVCNIKKKLGPHKIIINSVYGVGYKFDTTKAA